VLFLSWSGGPDNTQTLIVDGGATPRAVGMTPDLIPAIGSSEESRGHRRRPTHEGAARDELTAFARKVRGRASIRSASGNASLREHDPMIALTSWPAITDRIPAPDPVLCLPYHRGGHGSRPPRSTDVKGRFSFGLGLAAEPATSSWPDAVFWRGGRFEAQVLAMRACGGASRLRGTEGSADPTAGGSPS